MIASGGFSNNDNGESWKRNEKNSNNARVGGLGVWRWLKNFLCFHIRTTNFIVDIYQDGEWKTFGARQTQASTVKCRCKRCNNFFLKTLQIYRDNPFDSVKLQ